MKVINVGLIGFGTIGSGVVSTLIEDRIFLMKRLGFEIKIAKICDKDFRSSRKVKVKKSLLTRNPLEVVDSNEVDIVIELMGGIHPAKEYVLRALKNGKHVVTANKALLAQEGEAIFKAAVKYDKEVLFEAAVCGGIPIVKSIRDGMIANEFNYIMGIVNGTSNYILSRMQDEGCDFKLALREAQKKGFAEKNSALDINGIDAAHKVAILAYLAFGKLVNHKDVFVQGISGISAMDIQYANAMGYCIKHLAITKKKQDKIDVRVHPALVSKKHVLASVKGAFNGIKITGDMTKDLVFIGLGAGQNPTASAVVSDIVDLARVVNLGFNKRRFNLPVVVAKKSDIRKIGEVTIRYYIRFMTIDEPGTLSKIAGVLGKYNISIASVTQKERHRAKVVPIVMMTHDAKESNVQKALASITKMNLVKKKPVAIRVS